MANANYDVIVIGSGAGGMSAAVPLAQAGKKVLVLEQHYVPGGWTHSFTLDGYRFSPGVHYIGNIGPGGGMRRIYEGLGVSRDLQFCELNPDGFDHVFIGEDQFDIPKGRDRYADRLSQRFPKEGTGIRRFLRMTESIIDGASRMSRVRGITDAITLPFHMRHLLRWATRSGGDLISRFVKDPTLRAVLAAQSGDHGLPPSIVSAPIQAGVTQHYFNGGFYPLGGAFAIPRAFSRALKQAGGEIRLSARVDKILVDSHGVTGVQLADGTVENAKCVISNADPNITFGKLVESEHLSHGLRRRLKTVRYSGSALSLFMAVDMDLRAVGLDSGNYWFYKHNDLDAIYRRGLTDHVLKSDDVEAMFLTVTTLKDPSKMYRGHHTLEVFSFVGYEPFKRWAAQASGKRDEAYQQMKDRLIDKMLAAVERRVPGLRDNVVFKSLGTPLSNEHFLNATRGNLYGTSKERFQVGPWAFSNKTEINGLWLCGASTPAAHGVAGATLSGLQTAREILGCRNRELLQQDGPELEVYPSEHPEQWPDHLKEKMSTDDIVQPVS